MTKQELSTALEIAGSGKDLSSVDFDTLIGFGLRDFKPVHVTLEMVAKMIRYQCFLFNGGIDPEALEELASCGRQRFIII